MDRMSAAEYQALLHEPKKKGPKFGNRPCEYQSDLGFTRRYDSQLEARHAAKLDMMVRAGEISSWVPQFPFPLPGGHTHKVDFALIYPDGRVRFVESKGMDTKMGKFKRDQVEMIYGVVIDVWRK